LTLNPVGRECPDVAAQVTEPPPVVKVEGVTEKFAPEAIVSPEELA
jgi:hypothetical protein